MKRKTFLDLVIAGPDMSGTGTQVADIINYFKVKGEIVKDMRGTETDALFHADKFAEINKHYSGVHEMPDFFKKDFLFQVHELMSGGGTNEDLQIVSCVNNNCSTFVNPDSADIWVFEEPTKRGSGQDCRAIEQNRSSYLAKPDQIAASFLHQGYRVTEFLRFRKPLREKNKIIVRSRSEESACYQVYDKKSIPTGITLPKYLELPGHKIAFENSPTNIFVVCGPENWTTEDYLELKEQRSGGRFVDDYEKDASYQVLVNKRYATDWLENLYEQGCKMYGGKVPEITRFSIYDSIEEIRLKMQNKLEKII